MPSSTWDAAAAAASGAEAVEAAEEAATLLACLAVPLPVPVVDGHLQRHTQACQANQATVVACTAVQYSRMQRLIQRP